MIKWQKKRPRDKQGGLDVIKKTKRDGDNQRAREGDGIEVIEVDMSQSSVESVSVVERKVKGYNSAEYTGRDYYREKEKKIIKQRALVRAQDRGADIFKHHIFWLNGPTNLVPPYLRQEELRDLILRHGGQVKNTNGKHVTVVICTHLNKQEELDELGIKRRKPKFFVKPQWVKDSVDNGSLARFGDYVVDQLQPKGKGYFLRTVENVAVTPRAVVATISFRIKFENFLQQASRAGLSQCTSVGGCVLWVGSACDEHVYIGMPVCEAISIVGKGNVIGVNEEQLEQAANAFLESVKACSPVDIERCGRDEALVYVDIRPQQGEDLETTLEFERVKLREKIHAVLGRGELSVHICNYQHVKRSPEKVGNDSEPKVYTVENRFACSFQSRHDLKKSIVAMVEILVHNISFKHVDKEENWIWQLFYRVDSSSSTKMLSLESGELGSLTNSGIAGQFAQDIYNPSKVVSLYLSVTGKLPSSKVVKKVKGQGNLTRFVGLEPKDVRASPNSVLTMEKKPPLEPAEVYFPNEQYADGMLDTTEEIKKAILCYLETYSGEMEELLSTMAEFTCGLVRCEQLDKVQYIIRLLHLEIFRASFQCHIDEAGWKCFFIDKVQS
eukprot:CAMPEP_0203764408 /NCGR_PEP_ID=MMETSP0098-20131031/17667_1 /ASSEMBLY_ACC=CAM_ASM_000208 /TAXON_ID=96639 /ORGANISM=" , Strain NY0313808BC1" /LENGTH=611 /DNA_ID=CAMNT_0050660249 /DNA_START=140 /DNA_END=1971 /DNA_ORIENTATION=+